jgi:O-antigen ligase
MHLAAAGAVSVGVAWAVVFLNGGVDLLDPAWGGAKSLGIATNVIYPIAVGTLAVAWMARRHVPAWVAAGWVLACLLSLAIIKARSIILFTVLVVALLPLFDGKFTFRKVTPYLVVLGCAAFAIGLVAAFGGQPAIDSIAGQLWTYATIDTGGADVQTLTGRTPLWTELLRYASDRPWAGYGFGAFWNPDFMPAIASVVGWNAPSGHDGFLDEALATGIVGLTLFLCLWLASLVQVVALRVSRKDGFATWIAFALLFFLLCNLSDSILQNYTRFVFYASLTGLFALLGRHAREDEARSRPPRYGVVGMPAAARARSRSATDR